MTKKEIETQLSERNAIYTATVYAFAYPPNVLAIVTVKKKGREGGHLLRVSKRRKTITVLIGLVLPKMTFPSIYCTLVYKGWYFFYGTGEECRNDIKRARREIFNGDTNLYRVRLIEARRSFDRLICYGRPLPSLDPQRELDINDSIHVSWPKKKKRKIFC